LSQFSYKNANESPLKVEFERFFPSDSATKTSLMATEQTPIQLWMETFSNVFTETSLLKILATEFGLLTIRIVGWLAVELILYQGNQLGSKRKKRDYTEQGLAYSINIKVQSNLCTTTTLEIPKKWPLLTDGLCSEVIF